MNGLIEKLGIDETFTRKSKKQKVYNKVKNNIRHEPDCNMMADLLFLPTTKEGYKYLLVVVDLYTDEFDAKPLMTKQASEVLAAIKKIFKGKYLKLPAAIYTDSGKEFGGVFHNFFYNKGVLHSQTVPGRHKQMGNVESLNRTLGRLLNGYMNKKELETNDVYKEWTEILPLVIKELNKYRKERRGSIRPKDNPYVFNTIPKKKPKFSKGDLVHHKLDYPQTALGKKQPTANFREGDIRFSIEPKQIKKVIIMNDEPRYRYMLSGINNASYAENELFRAR